MLNTASNWMLCLTSHWQSDLAKTEYKLEDAYRFSIFQISWNSCRFSVTQDNATIFQIACHESCAWRLWKSLFLLEKVVYSAYFALPTTVIQNDLRFIMVHFISNFCFIIWIWQKFDFSIHPNWSLQILPHATIEAQLLWHVQNFWRWISCKN